ncbi:hypothetical protein GJAV_G00088720 [Gymnothorax javanicus]|nr:hypothetical protein GJAV_G00088720 [Gymnothorax javanicus]
MMQAGVRLRQDTETTLPELPEQHRIREKEEELHGLESVHMAESETKCTAPGPNTLEPECVTANSRVSDLHHTEASLIKTEADLSLINSGDLKTESLEFTELACLNRLCPDQIKTETNDRDYIKTENVSVLQDIKCIFMKSDEVKLESCEGLVSDLMNTELNGAGVDERAQRESWECAGEPNTNNKKSGKKQSVLMRDVQIHLRKMTPPYTLRERSFMNKSNLNKQQRIPTDERPYKCDQCEDSFQYMSHLKSHRRIHAGEKSYKCDQCKDSFRFMSNLISHQRIHAGEKPYKCDQSQRSFLSSKHLKSHQKVHASERPYKCDQCKDSFRNKSNLKNHQRIHAGEKPYKCDQSQRCFSNSKFLKSHQKIHTSERPYKCDLCKNSFRYMCNLKSHRRIHIGEKSYKCDQGQKCFFNSKYLKSPQKIDTSERPYKCDQCKDSFRFKSNLKSHQRIHAGEKPYKCHQC